MSDEENRLSLKTKYKKLHLNHYYIALYITTMHVPLVSSAASCSSEQHARTYNIISPTSNSAPVNELEIETFLTPPAAVEEEDLLHLVSPTSSSEDKEAKHDVNDWDTLFLKISQHFSESEGDERPLDDWFFVPTRKSVSNVPLSILKSNRYIPELLKGLGIAIKDGGEFSNGHKFVSLLDKIGKHKSQKAAFKYRFGLGDNQITQYNTCLAINFSSSSKGHGLTKVCQPPDECKHWPPQWFKEAASFLPSGSTSTCETDREENVNEEREIYGSPCMHETDFTSSLSQDTEMIDKNSFVPHTLQPFLRSYMPRLSMKTLQARKGKTLEWNILDEYQPHRNRASEKIKDLLCILHTLSGGEINAAKDIVEGVIKNIPTMLDFFDNSSCLDSTIVSSMKSSIQQFSNQRTKETQQFIDSIVAGAMHDSSSFSKKRVQDRLGASSNAISKASKKIGAIHDQYVTSGGPPAYLHCKRKTRKDAHAETGAEKCVDDYCHGDYNAIRIESNDTKPITVNGEIHPKRVWDGVLTLEEKYENFLESDEYRSWKSRQPKRDAKIGRRSFTQFICKCVKNPTGEDCVNLISSDLSLAMHGLRNAISITAKECQCEYHSQFKNGTSIIMMSENMALDRLLGKSNHSIIHYTCCKARQYDDLKCGIGSTATNPKFVPFECITGRCTKCGVQNVFGGALSCPILNDNATLCTIKHWESVKVTGCTQNECREMVLTINGAFLHLFECLEIARKHCVLAKWTRHARKLDQVMGNPFLHSVTCTDFMAAANLQSYLRDNSAIDAHAMNAIYFVYLNWRKVLFSTQRDFDLDMPEPLHEDWVWIDIGSTRPATSESLGILPQNKGVFKVKELDTGQECEVFSENSHDATAQDTQRQVEYGILTHEIDNFIIVTLEYEIKSTDFTIETYKHDFLEDRTSIRGNWVWVDGDECIINETHCFHFIGESETANKDNNHQYDNACMNDLIAHLASRRDEASMLSNKMEWSFGRAQPDILEGEAGVEGAAGDDTSVHGEDDANFFAVKGTGLNEVRNANTILTDIKHSDNCSAQYKCRHSAMTVANANDLNDKVIRLSRFALKFEFKGNWDGEGKVWKSNNRSAELKGAERLHNAWLAHAYGKRTLTKTGFHPVWNNVSVCDNDYIVTQKYDEEYRNHVNAACERMEPNHQDKTTYVDEDSPAGGYSCVNNGGLKYRREGTGGGFSHDMVRRAPPGTVLCSDDTILNKKISTLDSRTLKYATSNFDKYLELSSDLEHRNGIVYVDRREEVKPDPGVGVIPNISSIYEMGGTTSRNQSIPGSHDLVTRRLYCSCSVCKQRGPGNDTPCNHLVNMGALGHSEVVHLKNQGTVEKFRCLCCGELIISKEQALRHSVRRECDQLKCDDGDDGDAGALHTTFRTCMALSPKGNVYEAYMILPQSFDELFSYSFRLPYDESTNITFGLDIHDDNNFKKPYIAAIHDTSPCYECIPEHHRKNVWILSINMKESYTRSEVLDTLNCVEEGLNVADIRSQIANISRNFSSKKKAYCELARQCSFQINTTKKIDLLKSQIEACLDDYVAKKASEEDNDYKIFTIVISKRVVT